MHWAGLGWAGLGWMNKSFDRLLSCPVLFDFSCWGWAAGLDSLFLSVVFFFPGWGAAEVDGFGGPR